MGFNYNFLSYFEIREVNLSTRIQVHNHTYIIHSPALYRIDNHPQWVITDLLGSFGGVWWLAVKRKADQESNQSLLNNLVVDAGKFKVGGMLKFIYFNYMQRKFGSACFWFLFKPPDPYLSFI
jgi:hypothetical protein